MNTDWAKLLMITGAGLFLIGTCYYLAGDKMKFIGNLPGDIKIEKENFKFYFPITTMILASVLVNIFIKISQKLI